ncbi:MAG: HTTM domain-containing protein [Vicingaceae bacterium]
MNIHKQTHIAPLAIFRIVFGAILFFSIIRFIANGWVHDLYIETQLYFPYYGFEWVKPLPESIMYLVFGGMALSFLFQALGLFYRFASIFSFAAFTYVELIDKTNYLNHYYFVSIICFLLIFVPAHRYFSLDVWRKPSLKRTTIPYYFIFIFQVQLSIVYFFAGLAKLNYDWMVEALPLKIWLPAKANLPLIGGLLEKEWIAYLFSWFGAIYDLSIAFLLFYKPTRWLAYFLVIIFHLFTYWLFPIGMFPFIMIGATLIFFSVDFHRNIINSLKKLFKISLAEQEPSIKLTPKAPKLWTTFFLLFFLGQLIIPLRSLAYPGNLYWTEEGYRFSWRVMLMEKAGYAIFHVTNPTNGNTWEVNNYDFLSANQEKMMSTQPDMILQFAHFLENHYQKQGIKNPIITAEIYVSLNGSPSQLFIDPSIDLTEIDDSFAHKEWILKLDPKAGNE